MKVELTICSNRDLHEHDNCRLIIGDEAYHVVRINSAGLSWHEPSPEFVQEFLECLEVKYVIAVLHGVCDECLTIINQSQDLIHEVGGR